jgi:hypothetical protein
MLSKEEEEEAEDVNKAQKESRGIAPLILSSTNMLSEEEEEEEEKDEKEQQQTKDVNKLQKGSRSFSSTHS